MRRARQARAERRGATAPVHASSLPVVSLLALASAHVHRSGGGLSTLAIVLACVAGVLALACAAYLLARALAWEPRWASELRHAAAEAGFRASATWSEFTDWARLGR